MIATFVLFAIMYGGHDHVCKCLNEQCDDCELIIFELYNIVKYYVYCTREMVCIYLFCYLIHLSYINLGVNKILLN